MHVEQGQPVPEDAVTGKVRDEAVLTGYILGGDVRWLRFRVVLRGFRSSCSASGVVEWYALREVTELYESRAMLHFQAFARFGRAFRSSWPGF